MIEEACIEMAPRKGSRYPVVTWNGKQQKAHRVAWEQAHGPIPDGMKILHRCDNTRCVRVEHLFIGTQRDNIADMDAKGRRGTTRGRPHPGLIHRGEGHPNAKLTAVQVEQIRKLYVSGETQRGLAMRFGVSKTAIAVIVRGEGWATCPERQRFVKPKKAVRA